MNRLLTETDARNIAEQRRDADKRRARRWSHRGFVAGRLIIAMLIGTCLLGAGLLSRKDTPDKATATASDDGMTSDVHTATTQQVVEKTTALKTLDAQALIQKKHELLDHPFFNGKVAPLDHQGLAANKMLRLMNLMIAADQRELETTAPATLDECLDIVYGSLTKTMHAASFGLLVQDEYPWNDGGRRRGRGRPRDASDRNGVPTWEMDERFEHDVFRFVRVKYNSWGGRRYHRMGRWATDYPDSDLNFSWRLHQLTAIKVNPEPLYLELTDERLYDYPFLYMIEPGALYLEEIEVANLRRYLLNGGFMMVDDFWGSQEYENFYSEMKRVFPERELEELDISHKIFHYVYDLKEKPQVPSIHHWMSYGDSSERGWDSEEVHYRAIVDDNDRIMVLVCHNTDLGDGWEREGESREYFQLFSEKKAYPMGINIILYAMTH